MAKTDANLAGDVYSRLSEDSFVHGVNIGVRAKDGEITLSGLPQNSEKRARAISIAVGTPGVDHVTNSYY
jgi:osmotically-inducible protein OsmY